MEDDRFPKRIILEDEADNIRHDLRVKVQRIQSAYMELRDNPDFSLPSTLEQLNADYCHAFYKPFLDSITKDFTLDDEQRRKLKNRWGRIQAKATSKANVVCDGIKATKLLEWHFDDAIRLPIPTARIDDVAEQMASHDVPSMAREHWLLVKVISSAITELREWERKHGILKQPLRNLTQWNEREFVTQWVRGMTINPDEDERTRTVRTAQEKHIF